MHFCRHSFFVYLILCCFCTIAQFTYGQLVINVRNKGGDVLQETISANVTQDTINLEFQRPEGTFITHFIDFKNEIPEKFHSNNHTNNWAVLVCTSRFWFNYRHIANVLSMYRSVKRLGIPDSRIILMVADDMACNARNSRPASVFNNANKHIDVYGDDVEIDYRGYEVTVENFIRLLTGRHTASTPRSKRLLTDNRSNVLIYMTGHGGDGFLKFQDSEEITNLELGDAFEQMWQKNRYNEIFFVIDTCQAESMFQRFYSPNILAVASSKVGEDSLSHHLDPTIGVYIIDRYTYYALDFLERTTPNSDYTLSQFLKVCPKRYCQSTVADRTDLFKRSTDKVPITDFFGSVHSIELTRKAINFTSKVASRQFLANVQASNRGQQLPKYIDQFPIKMLNFKTAFNTQSI